MGYIHPKQSQRCSCFLPENKLWRHGWKASHLLARRFQKLVFGGHGFSTGPGSPECGLGMKPRGGRVLTHCNIRI